MKTDIKWLNKSQVRRAKSIYTWQDDEIYQAHSVEVEGFTPYVNKTAFDLAISALKQVAANGDRTATETLELLGV